MGTSLSSIRKKRVLSRSSQQTSTTATHISSSGGASSQQEKSTSTVIDGRTFHNTDSIYWLPNDDAENDRLVGQHFAMKSLFNGNFNTKVLDYVSMDDRTTQVLDCGCGPGTWIMDVATDYPNCQLTGIDISDVFPTTIRPPNVQFEIGNVLSRLPYEDNTFDFINLRFFILALRKNEWSTTLQELYRILKPGGVIESMECGQLSRGREFIDDLAGRVVTFMESRDQDPWIAQKIPGCLKTAGFEIIETTTKDIYLGKSDSINREFLWDVINIYKSIKPYMAAQLNIQGDKEYDEFLNRLAIECQQEPQAMWDMTSTLARKPSM
ncbi:S-adenosyl-L-methionine-dependent methyltransferase [Absidia repens]|uniref:S-adenosyl-L-methionine-dependent methyltransferase n=1 Tax=Absidia repens TaxID=90262 RepID=A0A1X2I951_9FUNG|nr:S-adenosyl-L-methionine-dependent methyltransferase [Absidia repens]